MYESAIAKGIEYIDSHFPADWEFRVNLDSLSMGDWCLCVWGQLSGGADDDMSVSAEHGFWLPDCESPQYLGRAGKEAVRQLQKEWVDAILARRAQKVEAEAV